MLDGLGYSFVKSYMCMHLCTALDVSDVTMLTFVMYLDDELVYRHAPLL